MKQSAFHQRQTEDTVRTERNFWQLVVILAALGGVILGAVVVRVGSLFTKDHRICVGPALVALQHTKETRP